MMWARVLVLCLIDATFFAILFQFLYLFAVYQRFHLSDGNFV